MSEIKTWIVRIGRNAHGYPAGVWVRAANRETCVAAARRLPDECWPRVELEGCDLSRCSCDLASIACSGVMDLPCRRIDGRFAPNDPDRKVFSDWPALRAALETGSVL